MSSSRVRAADQRSAKTPPSCSHILKVILLGDGGVGKSSLMNVFVHRRFDEKSFHTIGVEFLIKDIVIERDTYALQIWDTAGQERFKSLRTPFYRGADCCLLTFALNDRESFENLSHWKREFLHYADVQDHDRFPFVVLGNKSDLGVEQGGREEGERCVSAEEASAWCLTNGNIPYYETSAKDAINVDVAFERVARRVKELNKERDDSYKNLDTPTVKLSERRAANSAITNNSCC